MTLVSKITQAAITTDCLTFSMADTTGLYNVTTNPGGYGTPNPSRNSFAIIVFLLLHKSTGYELQPISSYSYTTAEAWVAAISEDGYYEVLAISAPIYSAGTFNLFDVVFYAGNFYQANKETTNDPTNTDDWAIITDNEDFQNGTNVYISSNDYLVTCLSSKCRANALIEVTKKGCCDTPEERHFRKIDMQLESAIVNAGFGNWENAQLNIEALQHLCSDLTCLDC